MKNLLFGILACCLLAMPVSAQENSPLRNDHPDVYTVVEGDTLWDIANRFLNDAWLWTDIWKLNDQIENPHLIFPGDQVALVYVEGQPRLMVNRGSGGGAKLGPRDVKLSPNIRSILIADAIPSIPLEDVNVFLSRSRIVGKGILEQAPYVVSGDAGHVIVGAGDRLYARGSFPSDEKIFGVFRGGQTFTDPNSGEVLGFEALDIGSGRLVTLERDIETLAVNTSHEEIRRGDRLLPYVEQRIAATFFPSAPDRDVRGVILAVEGGVNQIGKLDIVAVNLGERDGLIDGNVLAIERVGEFIDDPVTGETVKLPDLRSGLLMIFRTFDKMSYGLVLSATQSLRVLDNVRRP